MHTARRIFLVLVVMTSATFALTAGPAGARSLSVDERGFELVWNEGIAGKTALSFMDAVGHNIRCKVTLLGEWNQRVITKVPTGVAIINHGLVRECVGGAIVLNGFPWTLRYRSFAGTLPNITAIDWGIAGARIEATAEGITCEAITEAATPLVVRFEGFAAGRPQNVRADETRTIPLVGGLLCGFASPARVAGRGLVTNLLETEFLTFRLI